ncbi:MAG: lytic transglycosylase domain-containing protein [Rhodospirillales bacterium]|nr:lytic transglycosylase domain-containing protein [Rhodospirillales bacterium]
MKRFVLLAGVAAMAAMLAPQAGAQQPPKGKPAVAPAAKPAAAAAKPAARPAVAARGRPAFRPAAAPRQAYVPPAPTIDLDPTAQLPGDLPTVLDSGDVGRYQRIFAAQAGGDFAGADADIAALRDKTLLGYVLAQRYLATGFTASYDDLSAWLRDYGDHPDAPNLFKLALTRKPAGAPEPQAASFVSSAPSGRSLAPDSRRLSGGDSTQAATIRARLARMIEDTGFSAARRLLDEPFTQQALGAEEVGRWRAQIATRQLESGGADQPVGHETNGAERPSAAFQAGIAAWRKGNYAEAARLFESVAEATAGSAYSATIAGGAFWAARANLMAGNPERFSLWLKRAAIYDRTFYGLIALRTLGVEPRPQWRAADLDSSRRALIRDDRAGRRALALLQLKAVSNAEQELFATSLDADPRMVSAVLALAEKARLPGLALKVANAARERPEKIDGLDNALYPIPPYEPTGGFNVDRALVYAVMRQESAFNPRARSWAGAMGLMQLMPGTATLVERQIGAGGDRYQAAHNVALGQAYLKGLLDDYGANLFHAVPAYNAGPGSVNKWLGGVDAGDPLLFVATIPFNETRGYVEAVMSNYWIYRLRLGQKSRSLEQIAQHQWPTHSPQDVRR